MTRHSLHRLLVAALFLFTACGGRPTDPSLDRILPNLNKCLTPASAERIFGPPDQVTGSGLLIYGYRLTDGRTVWLSFPGRDRIIRAVLETPSGERSELPLRDC